ncbi:MAG: trypsin-like peptidase domain-containing protein [Planctomycetaceae bacterium]|nr:trypsin-like peptidase domain-containing protein [Planctomycetaceae bacterium]
MALESLTPFAKEWIESLQKRDPQLAEEAVKQFSSDRADSRWAPLGVSKAIRTTSGRIDEAPAPVGDRSRMPEAIAVAHTRPVFLIQNDRFVPQTIGPQSELWASRVEQARAIVDAAIPAVGRVEIFNHSRYDWGGTAWLVRDDILVTNRHVATLFAMKEGPGFVFRTGLDPRQAMRCNVDFLEEHQGALSRDFPILRVLWIAPPSGPDLAFLHVARTAGGRALPPHIELAADIPQADTFVCTIGYPARDPDAPDQSLVLETFGDVYEKKRLAPGQVMRFERGDLLHDCSTLKGNSGSVVLDLNTGRAVGLHYEGEFLRANYAVPAAAVKAALDGLGRIPRLESVSPVRPTPAPQPSPSEGMEWIIPIEIRVRIGGAAASQTNFAIQTPVPAADSATRLDTALMAARVVLRDRPEVLRVRLGKRMRNQWLTAEDVIVVEVTQKLPNTRLFDSGITPLPTEIEGVAVDVRTASVWEQLRSQGVSLAARQPEAPDGINYVEPTDFELTPVDEPMRARFHVSPDCGFPVLQEFFQLVTRTLTATMYEFDATHVFDALLAAVRPQSRRLRMVTHPQSSTNPLARFMRRLRNSLGDRFDHVQAGVTEPLNLFDRAYHIKIGVADSRWLWLSSGNWKYSGQPDINPVADGETSWTPLETLNRDWHVLIDNANLASQFERYVEHDFELSSQRTREAPPPAPLPDVFVPASLPVRSLERTAVVPTYFPPLDINRRLRIVPLLTPDFSVYIDAVLDLVRGAQRKILLENQSFNLLRDNNFPKFQQLFNLLVEKQQAGIDVRIIFRDAAEFGQQGAQEQEQLIARLLQLGFDEDLMRVQVGCHTKGVIVDSSRVLLGSHNLTNAGTHRNRDASLIVDDAEVARYFEQIFEFDWENLAAHRIPESVAGIRVANDGEATPPGMVRINAEDLFDSDFPFPSFFATLQHRVDDRAEDGKQPDREDSEKR